MRFHFREKFEYECEQREEGKKSLIRYCADDVTAEIGREANKKKGKRKLDFEYD